VCLPIYGNDLAIGSLGNDSIDGGAGFDTLYGDAGNDFIFGGQNDDFIDGGEGNDKLIGGTGSDLILGQGGNDTLTGFDPAFGGSNQLDTLTGGFGADYFVVNGGNTANPAYSFNGDADFVTISDFSGVGYPDEVDPGNGNPGEGDKIQLLASLKDYYFVTEGDGFKDIYINAGYRGSADVNDLIARVFEPTGFFNLETDIVYSGGTSQVIQPLSV
jgi:hypothetical protein